MNKIKNLIGDSVNRENLNQKTYGDKGFTLIELLVVIAIIGLLASVVLVSLNSARQKSRDAKRVSDMNQLAKALELFYNDAAGYPTGTGYTTVGGALLGSAILTGANRVGGGTLNLTPTYVTGLPTAPTPVDGNCTTTNNRYMYEADINGTGYTMTFCIGANVGGLSAGVRSLTPSGFK